MTRRVMSQPRLILCIKNDNHFHLGALALLFLPRGVVLRKRSLCLKGVSINEAFNQIGDYCHNRDFSIII